MSSPAAHLHAVYTLVEYLALERISNIRHEFVDGAIYAMAGGTLAHGRMVTRLVVALASQVQPRCEVFESNVRVRFLATDSERYPDVKVVRGPVITAPDDPDAITNPTVLVEVLSPSTEGVDRGAKLDEYRQLATLRAYLLVDPDRPHVEVWTRAGGDAPWREVIVTTGAVTLDAIGARLVLAELYAPA